MAYEDQYYDPYAGMDMGQWAPPPIEYPQPQPEAPAPPPAPPPQAPPPAPAPVAVPQPTSAVGRWKVGAGGAPEWEAGVAGPNQIDPNQWAAQQTAAQAAPQTAPPTSGQYDVAGTGGTYHEPGRTYQQVAGWDTSKLNDPSHQTTKYNFMRSVQQLGIPANSPGVLNTVADYMRNHGYPGTQVVGNDKIDFGDGYGPIDVLKGFHTGNPSWSWINVAAEQAAGGGVPPPPVSGGLPTMAGAGPGSAGSYSAGTVQGTVQGNGQAVIGGQGQYGPSGGSIMDQFMNYLNKSGISEYGKGLQNMLLGALQGKDPNTNRRFENAVELANKARRSQVNNMRAELASRNLLSEPGVAQGMEGIGLGNIEEKIAPAFAQEIRNIGIAEGDRWQELMDMGLRSARQAEGNMLGALTGAGQYGLGLGRLGLDERALNQEQQQFQARLALDYLQSDRNFQQFLAQHGLNVEQLQWEMEHGNKQLATQITIAGIQAGANMNEGGQEPADS